jgi:hypothetical protein
MANRAQGVLAKGLAVCRNEGVTETLLALSPSRSAAANLRTTWIQSSLQGLRTRGHFEAYKALLPTAHHEAILFCVAGAWLPLAVAREHYLACDGLGMSPEEQVAMGKVVSQRAQSTVLATAVRLAKTGGVTPWTILPQFAKLWSRGFDGGGVEVTKLGPKDARVSFVDCSLFGIPYFRIAFRGILIDITSLFCARAFVHDITRPTQRDTQSHYRFQWA